MLDREINELQNWVAEIGQNTLIYSPKDNRQDRRVILYYDELYFRPNMFKRSTIKIMYLKDKESNRLLKNVMSFLENKIIRQKNQGRYERAGYN